MKKSDRPFMSVSEAGALLGVGPTRARELAAAGLIPVAFISPGKRVVPKAAFDQWVSDKNKEALTSPKRKMMYMTTRRLRGS